MTALAAAAIGADGVVRVGAVDGPDVAFPWMARLLYPDGRAVPVEAGEHSNDGETLRLRGCAPGVTVSAEWRAAAGAPRQSVHGPFAGARWHDVTLAIRYEGEGPASFGVEVACEVPGTATPRWLIPGAFYRENRLESCRLRYPRYDPAGGDPGELVSDAWSFRSDRAALPAVFAWTDACCAALCTDETGDLGISGIGFSGQSAERTTLRLLFPYREEPVVYVGSPEARPAEATFHDWRSGEERTVGFRVYVAPPELHAYDPFVRAMSDLRVPQEFRPPLSLAEPAALAAQGLRTWHYRESPPVLYETAAFDRALAARHDRPHMHVAWVSGAPYAHALLIHGRRSRDPAIVAAATRVLDTVASGLAPSGFFWAEWTAERGWGTGWNPRGSLHARTTSEATLFLIRGIAAERAHGAAHPAWEAAVRSNLDAALAAQRADGSYGAYYDARGGDVVEWEGAAGLPWIAALLEGTTLFASLGPGSAPLEDGDRSREGARWRESALRAGGYYARFVRDEFIYGAPEDVHLAPTSEDGYNAVIAYVALHEHDPSGGWLDLACRAADWTMTFRWTYDIAFARDTTLARRGFRSRGADQASPANQHLSVYGLMALPEMLSLSRHAGDDHYRRRTADNVRCALQWLAQYDGDLGAHRGMAPERLYNTNCFGAKGELDPISHAWTLGAILYACEEVIAHGGLSA
ncbi:MAG: hypothetical protein ABR525_07000 [Candidatus Limnocylindria bacterium]